MNDTEPKTYTAACLDKVQILMNFIAWVEEEVRALGRSEEFIASMVEPHRNLLNQVLTEDLPRAREYDAADALAAQNGKADPLPSSNGKASVIGQVRELDLDARQFALREIETKPPAELHCLYRKAADREAPAWLNKQVKVTGTMIRNGHGSSKWLTVDEVMIVG
jgi:hypothetical protein